MSLGSNRGLGPATNRMSAWRKAVDSWVAEDRERRDKIAATNKQRDDEQSPFTFWFGLFMLAVLFVVGFYIFDTLKCDSQFSEKYGSYSCQAKLFEWSRALER